MKIGFLSEEYKKAFPDIEAASESDKNFSPSLHFITKGIKEGRHLNYDIKANIENCSFTKDGFLFISGWIFDQNLRENVLDGPDLNYFVETSFYRTEIPRSKILRYHRSDVNKDQHADKNADFGFFVFCKLDIGVSVSEKIRFSVEYKSNDHPIYFDITGSPLSSNELINQYLKLLDYLKHSKLGYYACMEAYDAHGKDIIDCWQKGLKLSTHHKILRGNFQNSSPLFSMITVVYGTAELLPIQFNLLFSEASKIGAEIIVVCNSPELSEQVINTCKYAEMLNKVSYTIVFMSGNTGFSAANNIGVRYAKSKTLIFVNPDIFPSQKTSWPNLLKCINQLDDKTILSPILQYSDGSIMHYGMKILADILPIPSHISNHTNLLLRVDHPGKGFAEDNFKSKDSDRINAEAVTGGFLICTKKLFDSLDGFSTDYLYGHYEDADFCLRARDKKYNIFCATNLYFVHLEGKGSKTNDNLVSSGSSIFNRCHFSRKMREFLIESARKK